MNNETPYNPLDKRNLANSIAEAMLQKNVEPLALREPFVGAGIYAIYYTGDFPTYRAIADLNRDEKFQSPIYVGKAVPSGSRKGGFLDENPGMVLFKRLKDDHASSIEQAQNLDIKDFFCRYLVLDDIWIPLGESLLIDRFAPVWNQVIDGFGNHDPGSGRYGQKKSSWDEIHPGRTWAEKLQPSKKAEAQILEEVERYL